MRIETKGVHVGEGLGKTQNGDVVVPIHTASTFARRKVDNRRMDMSTLALGILLGTFSRSALPRSRTGPGGLASHLALPPRRPPFSS